MVGYTAGYLRIGRRMQTIRHSGALEPGYFGDSEQPLAGCHHFPQTDLHRSCAIVLCNPMGDEYIRVHRAYTRLASQLSSRGFHVLRFDFHASGNSSGDCAEARIDHWQTDISSAIEEVCDRSGASTVCLIGLRLGGTLALMSGAQAPGVEGMVLWDPVVSGAAYADELISEHQQFMASFPAADSIPTDGHIAQLWFPLTPSLVADLNDIDLLQTPAIPERKVLLIETQNETNAEKLQQHLVNVGARLESHHLPEPRAWIKSPADEFDGLQLISNKTLQCICDWVSEKMP